MKPSHRFSSFTVSATSDSPSSSHLEALAFGFGAGFLFMTGYSLFERIGAPAMSVSDPVAVIAFGWVLGQLLAMRRYL